MALAGEGPEAMEADFSPVSLRLLSFTVLHHSPTHPEGHTPPPSPRSAALPPAKAEGRLAGMVDPVSTAGVRVPPGLAPSEDVGRESVVWSACSLGWSKLQQIIN